MSFREARVRDAQSTRGPALLRLLRPHHWLKNGFVLLPVPFSLAAGAQLELPRFLAGFAGFCLLNSAVYVLNDIRDAEADRLSPRKRTRPIAAGEVSLTAAWATFGATLACALALGAATGLAGALAIYAIYLVANVVYSLGAKHVPLLDVFILASGFLLRVLLGTALVEAPPSSWLLLCTSALALFLAFAKRRGDLAEGVGAEHRPALSGYNERFLDSAIGICAGLALVTYALYCGEAEVLAPGREMASLPPVAFAIFQYLRLALVAGAGANPVTLAWSERSLQVCGLLWLATIGWSLGLY
jgi:4-hydroxybenzoate polyprenyltransferase